MLASRTCVRHTARKKTPTRLDINIDRRSIENAHFFVADSGDDWLDADADCEGAIRFERDNGGECGASEDHGVYAAARS